MSKGQFRKMFNSGSFYAFTQYMLKKLSNLRSTSLKFLQFGLGISFTGLSLFIFHRQISYFNKVDLFYMESPANEHIIRKISPFDYKPTIYLPTCLSMMIYNETKPVEAFAFKRQYLNTGDGGLISLDWTVKSEDSEKSLKFDKLLVILHGLTGGSESSYIREIASEYNKIEGFKVVCVNYRGVADNPLLTPFIYHAGYTEDLYAAMKYIKTQFPNVKCYALGTSMGANIFAKMFAKHDDFTNYVKGFISISNPFNCFEVEKRNRGSVLDKFLIRRQLRYMKKHKDIFNKIIDFERLVQLKFYRDFDSLVTLKFFQFKSVDDYYIEASSYQDICNINIPSIFFNARDDPLSPIDSIDLDATFKRNPNLILILTRWGGHCCWFQGWRNPKRWFINKTIKYIEALEELETGRSEINPSIAT